MFDVFFQLTDGSLLGPICRLSEEEFYHFSQLPFLLRFYFTLEEVVDDGTPAKDPYLEGS